MRAMCSGRIWWCCGLAVLLTASTGLGQEGETAATAKAEAVAPMTVAHVELKGALREGAALPGLFGEIEETLSSASRRLERAAKDDDVSAIVLHISSPGLGWGKLGALRQQIARIRQQGKPVYAWMEGGMTKDYLLAAACEKIFLPESGYLLIPGVRSEVTFYKDMFDKLDLQAETLRVGEYKSAGEPFSRSEMSPEFRQEMEEVLNDVYEQIVAAIARDRKLSVDEGRAVIDRGVLTAQDAVAAKLIDGLCYEDELATKLKGDSPREVKLALNYGKKKLDTDFSGMAGMIKMMNLMMGIDQPTRKTSTAKVAVIYATGPIVDDGGGLNALLSDETITPRVMVKAIRQARDDKTVKAIVLRVNSPGGSALASDLIWRELELTGKPVIASMGDVAASGGYYISMGADRIFAEPETLTGSIGVVSIRLAASGLYRKLGMNTEVIHRGKNTGLLSTTNPLSESERSSLQSVLDDIYRQFTTKAAAGRKMDVDALEKLARGRVYTGSQAQKLGLVDDLGTLEDAIAYARQAAGLGANEKLERLVLPKMVSPIDQLLGLGDNEVRLAAPSSPWMQHLPAEVTQLLGRHAIFSKLAKQPAAVLLPFDIRIE